MSDGSIESSGIDDRSAVTQSKLLPGRLQTSDHLGCNESEQPPVHSAAHDAVEGDSALSSARPGISRYNSFKTRTPSWNADTVTSVDIPVVPTSMEPSTEESNRTHDKDQEECESQTETSGEPVRLVKRSSLNRNGSGSFRVSRVHPILSNEEESSRSRRISSDKAIDEESERLSSFDDQGIAPVIGKKLSLHKVQVASQSDSVKAVMAARSSQPSVDPSIHRMIYFRTKKELSELFKLPDVSMWGRRFNRIVFVLILLGIADLAIETCDGPNMGSTDPGYPYLPSEADHEIYDGLFAGAFTLEFLGRIIETRNARAIVRDPFMWLDFIGISPWYIVQSFKALGNEIDVEHHINLLRLLRTARLAVILRHYEQSKIIFLAIKSSLRPLGITLFFLFTLVMIIATAIFYAEPCYNVETCTFTDIFNSAYFVMVTVATVGYGNQVPSLKNPGSMMLTMVAMILGQIYFSMPVAIIGNNFQLTNENFQMDKKKKVRYLDASLSPFDCQNLHNHAKRLCDIQYHLLKAWSVVHSHICHISRTNTRSTQSMTMEMLESETDHQIKVKEGISRLLEVHDEAVTLLDVFIPHRRKSFHMNLDFHGQGVLSNMYAKAKRAINKAKVKSGHPSAVVDPRIASQTLKGRIWLLLEVPESSRLASIVNQTIVGFALVSIMLFFTESLQELAASGVETNGCKSVVKNYCGTTGFGAMDPACFKRFDNGTTAFTERLHFSCSSITESPSCYGNGLNFGSLNASALPCQEAFLESGADFVCYRQQCRASLNIIFDMGPYWIYFEWLFGLVFSVELALRFYISQNRKEFWKNFYVFFDVVAIVPFFVEVIELLFARIQPDYAIVATAPSFLSVIRVLKIMRILKLTRHFRGTKVLASTAINVWKPLVIPLFFLFTGCIIAGAVFYEIERGRECFVGEVCMWWNKDVLTPELAAGLPVGKRILIQDKMPTIITDMIHSTWLSYTTLTSVGFGDLTARTAIGKFFDVFVIIVATIYSAMPLSLVGTQFYSLYEKHMEKMVVKQGGSSISWRTKNTISMVAQYKQIMKHPSARKPEIFTLSDEHLMIAHEFENMKRTMLNVQRTLEAVTSSSLEVIRRKSSLTKGAKASVTSSRSMTGAPGTPQRSPVCIDQSIEQKSFAIMDTLLQFSQVVEKLQEAPVDFEAFEEVDDDIHSNIFSNDHTPRRFDELDTFQ